MLVGPCALAGLPLRCPLACRAAAPCAAPSLRWSAAPRPSASMLPAAPCPSTMFCGLLPAPPPAGHSPVLSHPSLRWRLACSLAQTAGGAGCGQPPAHKACRKIDCGFAVAANPTTSRLYISQLMVEPAKSRIRVHAHVHLASWSAANSFD